MSETDKFKNDIEEFITSILLGENGCKCAHCEEKNCAKPCKDETFEYKIYNEFSLQHELGQFLLNKDYNVFYEKNVKEFLDSEAAEKCIKKEVDIIAIKENKKYAIELKFPKNGQYPEEMKKFIVDMCFMKQVKKYWSKENKNVEAFCLTLVNDPKFHKSKNKHNLNKNGIYSFFRCEQNKPIYKQSVNWHDISQKLSYYFIAMS